MSEAIVGAEQDTEIGTSGDVQSCELAIPAIQHLKSGARRDIQIRKLIIAAVQD